jgi:uracil DNA glycosylase
MQKKEFNSGLVHSSYKHFIQEMSVVLKHIRSNVGENFVPFDPFVFKCFEIAKSQVKFVLVGQDPYPQKGHATGRSFERNIDNWSEANKSLHAMLASIYYHENREFKTITNILNEIENGRYDVSAPKDIFKEWESKYGVLFLNRSLTTELGKKNAHAQLWKPFTESVVKYLSKDHSIKWLLWGKEAQELEEYIENKSSIIKTIHPAAFSYAEGTDSEEMLKRFVTESGINLILNPETKNLITKTNDIPDIDSEIRKLQDEIERLQRLKNSTELQHYIDPDIEELIRNIESLEFELIELEAEKAEAEKLISEFNHRFNIDLGDLILKILEFKKFIVKDNKEKFKEAQCQEERFKEQFNAEKKRVVKELSLKDKSKLKALRNKAAKLCHPDKLQNETDEIKQRANEISIELNEAYQNNDLEKVEHLLKVLESGDLIPTERTKDQRKESLKLNLEQLKVKIICLKRELHEILKSETYHKVKTISNWDEYFENLRNELEQELERLKNENNEAEISSGTKTEERKSNESLRTNGTKISSVSEKSKPATRSYGSSIQYKPCPECGEMHNAAYTRCAVCNDFSASNDPNW